MTTFYGELLQRLGLPIDDYGAKVTVFGFLGVSIEGHKGLIDCSDDTVKVRLKGKILIVSGKNLKVREVTADELMIRGSVVSLEVRDV